MSKMTRRDFVLIADTIRQLDVDMKTRDKIADAFADVLAGTNGQFDRDRFVTAATKVPDHNYRGKPIGPEGLPYGVPHDYDCPACIASGASFTASPRSETYWSS